jgi:hypothetical protein
MCCWFKSGLWHSPFFSSKEKKWLAVKKRTYEPLGSKKEKWLAVKRKN